MRNRRSEPRIFVNQPLTANVLDLGQRGRFDGTIVDLSHLKWAAHPISEESRPSTRTTMVTGTHNRIRTQIDRVTHRMQSSGSPSSAASAHKCRQPDQRPYPDGAWQGQARPGS